MYLRKLEIHGFKSFAKKTTLEFEPGITSVVGPNGSGKSNLADALRWVFGEQSMKLLRSKKAEDVIFAGSAAKARLGSTEVSVSFDNTDRIMPVDYSEAVITRRVFRDGNSEYLLNRNQVRLLDIQELLGKSGFGNTSYHVIGQGMIDQLILGGPAAVKDLLEEASGVKPYYRKREQTLRKLERTGVNLQQVEVLIAEIEPRLRSLRRQTRKYEQRADIEKELRQAQAAYFSHLFLGLDRQIQEVGNKILFFDRQLSELNQEIASFSKDIETEEKRRTTDRTESELRQKLQELQKTKLKLLEEQAELRGKLKAGSLSADERAIDWPAVKNGFQKVKERLRGLLRDIQKWQADPDGWQKEATEIEQSFENLWKMMSGDNNSTPGAEKKSEQQRLHFLEEELSGLSAKISSVENSISRYTAVEQEQKSQMFVKERLLRNKQDALVKTHDQKNQLQIEEARLLTRREAHEGEAVTALGDNYRNKLQEETSRDVSGNLSEKIQRLTKQLEMIGGVDELVLQEFKETEERHLYLTTQSADLIKAVADLNTAIENLDEVIKTEFQDAFTKISEKFSEYFQLLFSGGRAIMTVMREKRVDSAGSPDQQNETSPAGQEEDPETGLTLVSVKPEITGIDIRATPPGKKLAGIAALSGGERALTAIALLSAILACFPSPFVVLDEVDAALDEANSIRFGKILRTLSEKTQFITITHNRETMRQSHTLYGVTMGDDGVSKILSLKLDQAAVYSTKN